MPDETIFHLCEIGFYTIASTLVAYYLPFWVTLFVFLPLCVKVYSRLSLGMCRSINHLDGKTVIVTGANVGIGYESAKDFAKRGAKVILACRNMETGNKALESIKRETGNQNVTLKNLDLSSLASVRKFATEIKAEESRLDILVNNAGAATLNKELTKDKIEMNFQANHYGPFLLTNLLLDLMRKSEKARIVNVSSDMHKFVRTFDFDNLNSEKDWNATMVYARTKLANVLFTKELDRKLKSSGILNISVNAVHPGGVRTEFLRYANELWFFLILGIVQRFFFKNALEGAQTTIHVAVADEVDGVSGEYFADCQKTWVTKLANDSEIAKKLWDHSAKLVHLRSEDTIFN